ncbi:heterokaryon incompatibility protein-domain-containing protein, partial [Tricladium varicosporioides]
MSSLPKTFEDAVVITRFLGIRYLWIDALCILQDCEDDWRVQAANMAQVYKNSFLTISAVDSEDSRGGCFLPRPPMTRLKFKPLDSPSEIFFAQHTPYGPLSRKTKLDNRAWCFQEMVLSPRVLLYGHEMMGWLCNSTKLHENSQSPISLPKRGSRLLEEYNGQRNHTLSWMKLVEDYTSRDLTFERDKLPACLTKDYYLAGLWRKDLLVLFLWRVTFGYNKMISDRTTQCQAPSWSWASINGAV